MLHNEVTKVSHTPEVEVPHHINELTTVVSYNERKVIVKPFDGAPISLRENF